MRNDFSSGYLQHHGIQGQKWGVRNGPPYPLDSDSKSSSEKKTDKTKGLTKKEKTYIAIGAAVAVTALATYGACKLGGLRGVVKATKNLASNITSGKKASQPYMKMNLQYFAKNGKKTRKRRQQYYRFKSKEEYARVMHVINTDLTAEEKKMPRLVKAIQTDEKHNGAYHYHFVNQDGNGAFACIKRVPISGAGTGVLERGELKPDGKPKL